MISWTITRSLSICCVNTIGFREQMEVTRLKICNGGAGHTHTLTHAHKHTHIFECVCFCLQLRICMRSYFFYNSTNLFYFILFSAVPPLLVETQCHQPWLIREFPLDLLSGKICSQKEKGKTLCRMNWRWYIYGSSYRHGTDFHHEALGELC